uniref:Large ribosomal subunit protein uL23c n=1 Tax=Mallomonas splendens TaxID=52552 RepID=A0A3G2R0D8_9STRA|nr:ribosomal protein L23 [Mallomonas splendens]AYO28581.1 ribosomal protein L23 [Mallomonas splendens]
MENNTNNFLTLLNLIKYPCLTEKAINLYGNSQYTFIVDKSLTKIQIKFIIQKLFNVNILSVNTCNLPTKTRRVGKFIGKRSKYKKAYISLKEGEKIADLFN